MVGVLFHFSEDPGIERFTPHVPATNPTHPPAVWAIDSDHQPLYWFPRNCPRATVWGLNGEFGSAAARMHATELRFLDLMRTTTVYRYVLPPESFTCWPDADGQYVSAEPVVPLGVEPVGDLLGLHVEAGIELRFVPNLWPLIDAILASGLDFSIVRKHLASPRPL